MCEMNVLVVAAHPDDEVLGCGATLARLAREGRSVYVTILGEGITARLPQPAKADPASLNKMRHCSQRVAHLLGVKELSLHDLPDNRFDSIPLLHVIKLVEESIERWQPTIIYTHHASDLNIDHQVVNRAVLTAARPVQGQAVREIYMFEVPSSTEWGFQQLGPTFKPNVFVNIADTLALKLEGMKCYETEVREFPHPRSPEALTAIARRWGSVVGCQAAEAFEAAFVIR
jgi:LmbE family N-acetylglucosaminyl deacetylase